MRESHEMHRLHESSNQEQASESLKDSAPHVFVQVFEGKTSSNIPDLSKTTACPAAMLHDVTQRSYTTTMSQWRTGRVKVGRIRQMTRRGWYAYKRRVHASCSRRTNLVTATISERVKSDGGQICSHMHAQEATSGVSSPEIWRGYVTGGGRLGVVHQR